MPPEIVDAFEKIAERVHLPIVWKRQLALFTAICTIGSILASAVVHYSVNVAQMADIKAHIDSMAPAMQQIPINQEKIRALEQDSAKVNDRLSRVEAITSESHSDIKWIKRSMGGPP